MTSSAEVSKKKVLLVSFHQTGSEGLRVISSILRWKYDASFLFLKGVPFLTPGKNPEINTNTVTDFCRGYDYVLLRVMTLTAPTVFALSDSIREKFPDKKVILGGPLAIVKPELCLQHSDYVCVFEGEGILELLEHLDEGRTGTVGNFVCDARSSHSVLSGVRSLDSLPTPDYSKNNEYVLKDSRIVKLSEQPNRTLFQTVRGCPHSCTYCTNAAYNKIKMNLGIPVHRFKSMRNTFQQLESIQKQVPGIRTFDFTPDDNFLSHDASDIEEFALQYDERIGLPLHLVIDLRAADFHTKISFLSRMKNLNHVSFGVESGSEEFNRTVYGRHQSNTEMLERFLYLKTTLDRRVELVAEMMYCHPEESKEDILKSINLMLKMKGARFSLSHFVPLPGTVLGEKYLSSDFSVNTLGSVDHTIFSRFPFYYFFMFAIKYARSYDLGFLLPQKFRETRVTKLLNTPQLSKLYLLIINLSVWRGSLPHMGWKPKDIVTSFFMTLSHTFQAD